MNVAALLACAGVPADLHAEALECFAQSKRDCPSHVVKHWHRWTKAEKIADALAWKNNRLVEVRPDLIDLDVAPMLNITAHGDNGPWVMTPEGGRPNPDAWLNADPISPEFMDAVDANYWLPGTHPRSWESRKAWYRRNGGEGKAWRKGKAVDPAVPVQEWGVNGVTVLRCGAVWQAFGTVKIAGPLRWKFDIGYELANVFVRANGKWVQGWFPVPGYELRACVCWLAYPTIFKA